MRRSGQRRRVAATLFAVVLAVAGGVLPSAVAPVAADCGTQFPATRIGPHRGFAFEGVIRSVEQVPAQFLDRITMDVTAMLAGDPVAEVVFDLGRGDCSFLQGDRYKVGDRLIVTASAAPVDAEERYLPDALTWRHEWGDTWTFHGVPAADARRFSAPIRAADTRAEILALVAPDALPFGVDPGAWSVALARPGSGIRLLDVAAFRDGFVALGIQETPRGQRKERPDRPVVLQSDTGRRWSQVADPFADVRGPDAVLERLLVFRDELYALGRDRDSLIAWVSSDGRDWSSVLDQPMDDDGPSFEGDEVLFLTGITAAATTDRMVVLGWPAGATATAEQTRVWTTVDGRSWTRATPTGLDSYTSDLVATPGGFAARTCMCASRIERWMLKTSADGVAWTHAGEAPFGTIDLAWDDITGRYLAAVEVTDHFDGEQAAVDASTDGVTWSRLITSPGVTSLPTEVAADGATIVLLGSSGRDKGPTEWTMSSPDSGATWTYAELPRTGRSRCVATTAAGEDGIVAVGGCSGTLAWVAPSGGAAP